MTITLMEKQNTTPNQETSPEYTEAKDAFYEARELRDFGRMTETELETIFRTFRSQAFQAMSAGSITIQKYLEIMLLYPDDTSRHGIKPRA